MAQEVFGELREFLAEGIKAIHQAGGDFADDGLVHEFELALGGELQGQKAVEVFLPSFDSLKELLDSFLLILLLKLVDFGHNWAHALEFALVLRANDFLQGPLNHEISGGVFAKARRNTRGRPEKQGRYRRKTGKPRAAIRFEFGQIWKGMPLRATDSV